MPSLEELNILESASPSRRTMRSVVTMRSFLFASAFLLLSGCAPRVDHADFEQLYRSGKAISSATEVGINYSSFSDLVQKFASEVSIAKDSANNQPEKNMTDAYQEALTAYRDSLVVWKNEIDGAGYDWIPKGEIYVEDELRPIIAKYALTTQVRSIEITGHRFETIPEASIQIIWARAGKLMDAGSRIFTGK
jgi:hypothetical protein